MRAATLRSPSQQEADIAESFMRFPLFFHFAFSDSFHFALLFW